MPIVFGLTGLSLIAAYWLWPSQPNGSSSSINQSNTAATSNFLPVTVKAEGEVVELLVAEGDTVKKGDVLMRLENPSMQIEKNKLADQLATAKAKMNGLKRQLDSNEKRMKLADEKLTLDLVVAESKLEAATENLEVAKFNHNRMKPAFDSGAVTTLEFEVVRQELLAAKANKMTAENAVKQIEFAKNSLKDNILIIGAKFDDENGRLKSELEVATAEQKEHESALAAANDQLANLNVKTPRDGTVSAVYRQVGELVKVADETFGLSFDSETANSLTDGESIQETSGTTPRQNDDTNVERTKADKVAAGM